MRIVILLLASVLLAAVGCGSASSTPGRTVSAAQENNAVVDGAVEADVATPGDVFASGRDANDITINGWKIVYPKSLKKMKVSMINDVLKIKFEEFTFEVRDDTIFVDGKSFGRASSGDEVQIGMHGEIAINGAVRQPITEE